RRPPRPDLRQLLVERRLVRVEHPLRQLPSAAQRDRPQARHGEGGQRVDDPFLAPLLLALVEVLREVALERPADLPPVGAHRLQRLLDLLGKQLRRELLLLAGDRPLRPAEDPLRAADRQERPACGDPGGLPGVRPDLGRDVHGRPACGLQPVDLVPEVGPGGYDRFPSGIRARAHSIVSFVVSIVRVGQYLAFSFSVSNSLVAIVRTISTIQMISPTSIPIAAPTRGPGSTAVSPPIVTPTIAPTTRPAIAGPGPPLASPTTRPTTAPMTPTTSRATTSGRTPGSTEVAIVSATATQKRFVSPAPATTPNTIPTTSAIVKDRPIRALIAG